MLLLPKIKIGWKIFVNTSILSFMLTSQQQVNVLSLNLLRHTFPKPNHCAGMCVVNNDLGSNAQSSGWTDVIKGAFGQFQQLVLRQLRQPTTSWRGMVTWIWLFIYIANECRLWSTSTLNIALLWMFWHGDGFQDYMYCILTQIIWIISRLNFGLFKL